jgi:hypothetical protein
VWLSVTLSISLRGIALSGVLEVRLRSKTQRSASAAPCTVSVIDLPHRLYAPTTALKASTYLNPKRGAIGSGHSRSSACQGLLQRVSGGSPPGSPSPSPQLQQCVELACGSTAAECMKQAWASLYPLLLFPDHISNITLHHNSPHHTAKLETHAQGHTLVRTPLCVETKPTIQNEPSNAQLQC